MASEAIIQPASTTEMSSTEEARDNNAPVQSESRSADVAHGKFTSERLSFRRVVGTGTYGRVKLAQDKETLKALAVKEIAKVRVKRAKDVAQVMNEKCILASLRHPLIVDYYGTFQDGKKLSLVMEYVQGGELYSFLAARRKFTLMETRFFAAEIAAVFTYLHSEGVVYRDLKCENVLIAKSGHIKLADFGCAKRLKSDERTFTICGTCHSLAPEMLTRGGYSFQVDWWTLGIFMHQLLTGTFPFQAESPYVVYSQIVHRPYSAPMEADSDLQELLEGLLTKDPSHRFDQHKVYSNRFFSRVNWDQLESLRPCFLPTVKTEFDDSNFDQFEEEPEPDGEIRFEEELQGY